MGDTLPRNESEIGSDMAKRLYVGNIGYDTSEQTLTDAFAKFGKVKSAKILQDRETGASRGFGFVEYPTDAEGDAAIAGMTQVKVDGRLLKVNEAKERPAR